MLVPTPVTEMSWGLEGSVSVMVSVPARLPVAVGLKVTLMVQVGIFPVPLVVRDRLIGVAEVINRRGGGAFTAEELDLFATYCRQAAVAVQNARLHTVLLERQRAQQELEFAALVQQSFLPEHCPV